MTGPGTTDAAGTADQAAGEGAHPPFRLFAMVAPASLGAAHRAALWPLLAGLAARGHAVTVVAPAGRLPGWDPDALAEAGCRLLEVAGHAGRGFGAALVVRRLLRRGAFDVCVTADDDSLALLFVATLAMRGRKPIVHLQAAGTLPDRSTAGRLRSDRVGRIVVASGYDREAFVRRRRVVRRKISIVSPGVDTARLDPDRIGAAGGRAALGLTAASPVVGFLAPDGDGADQVVAVARMVLHQVPEARFVVLGPGDPGPVLTAAAARGVDARFHAASPVLDEAHALAAVDLVADAGSAGAIRDEWLTALAMGRPVVAAEGVAASVVDHGRTGFLAAPGDARAVAGRIVELLRQDGQRRRYGSEARATAISRFSLSARLDGHERIFHELLKCFSTAAS